MPTVAHHYGPDPDQVVHAYPLGDTTLPDPPAVVLVHGGYWRSRFTAELMHPLAQKFQAGGWQVFNLEYRRGTAVDFAQLLADTVAGLELIRSLLTPRQVLVGIGHSVGGQIVLLNAQRLDAVVALAPVTDVPRTLREALGDGAVAEFFGADKHDASDELLEASPLLQLTGAITTPVLLVQGADDDRVPAEHSMQFLRRSTQLQLPVDALFLAALDHLEQINPAAAHWSYVETWLESRVGRSQPD